MFDTSDVRAAQLQHLADLGDECTPVFWQSWFVYPHTGLAELHSGSWDFKSITPLLQDMLGALGPNRELSLQFGTIPQWMLSGAAGAAGRAEMFPADPAQLVWGEEQPCTQHPTPAAAAMEQLPPYRLVPWHLFVIIASIEWCILSFRSHLPLCMKPL